MKKKQEERKEREKEKERMVKSDIQPETKDKDKPSPRLSKSFIERMSAPKHASSEKKESSRESTPVKVCYECCHFPKLLYAAVLEGRCSNASSSLLNGLAYKVLS